MNMSNTNSNDLSLVISLAIGLGACYEQRKGSCNHCECGKNEFDAVSFASNFKTKGLNYTCTCGHNINNHNPV